MRSLACLSRIGICVALLTLGTTCFGGDILNNTKLNKAICEGVSLDVILDLIAQSICHFDASTDALIEVQKCGKKGGWKDEAIAKLQKKVIEVSGLDQRRLKELVDKWVNTCENTEPRDDEYELTMRSLLKEGSATMPFLLKQLSQESPKKRGGVVDAMGRIMDKNDDVVRQISMMLIDRDKRVRLQAARACAALANENTCKLLTEKLNARNEKLDGVAMALGYLGDAKGIEPLARLLKLSNDSDARVCAAWALGELRAKLPIALDTLLEVVLDERDADLRNSAAHALALIGERRTPSYIIKAFERFRQGRENLIRHLAYFKDGDAIEFLIDKVEDDNPQVKKAAKETLALLTGEPNLESKDDWVGWWNVNQTRPDWIRSNAKAPKIPEPRR
ncbi:MAG: HEAT repeat domain-containing protein [Planctomycetota bacterium]